MLRYFTDLTALSMTEWPKALRSALTAVLPTTAFLKRDRQGCFVTNAPFHAPRLSAGAVREMGFDVVEENGLWRIAPGLPLWMRFEEIYVAPLGDLSVTLTRYQKLPPGTEGLRLFAAGTRLLEASTPPERILFDKQVRQRAAFVLRTAPEGLYPLSQMAEVLTHIPQ